MTVQERIRKIADDLFDGNVSAFCRAIDVKQPTINTIIGERQSKPSYEILSNIINAEALNISAQWLLIGKGEMLKLSTFKENQVLQSAPITNERLFSMIESQQRTIESQQVTIGSMQEQTKKMLAQMEDAATCANASGFELGK